LLILKIFKDAQFFRGHSVYQEDFRVDGFPYSIRKAPPVGRRNFEGMADDTAVNPAKTAEPIEMLFGMLSRVVPRNYVLDGGAGVPMGRGTLRGVSSSLQSIGFRGLGKRVSCVKRVDRC